jgi:hypothetical protein
MKQFISLLFLALALTSCQWINKKKGQKLATEKS